MCQDERAYRAKPLKDRFCPKGCKLQVWELSMITANSNLQAKRSLLNTARMYIASPEHPMSGPALKHDTPHPSFIASAVLFNAQPVLAS